MARAKVVDSVVKKAKAIESQILRNTQLYHIRPKTPQDVAEQIIRSWVTESLLKNADLPLTEEEWDGLLNRVDIITEELLQEISKVIPLAPPTYELNQMTPEERFKATYPAGEFNSFDEAMAYQGYIVPFFNGTHGVFRLYNSRTQESISYTKEQQLAFASVGQNISLDGGIINDWSKEILYLGKVLQTVYPARVYITSLMVSKAGYINSQAKPESFSWNVAEELLKGGIEYITLLKELIPNEPYINNAKVADAQIQKADRAQDGFDSVFKIEGDVLKADFGNDVLLINSSFDRANLENGIVRISSVKDVKTYYYRTEDSNVDVRLISTNEYLVEVLGEPIVRIEEISSSNADVLGSPKYLFETYNPVNATILNDPEIKIDTVGYDVATLLNNPETLLETQGVVQGVKIFEDDTGDVEQAEFLATPKIKDNDVYRTNLGGGADYYSGLNLAGWDTLANNPTSSTVTYNRARDVVDTPKQSRPNYLETFVLPDTPKDSSLLSVPSLSQTKDPSLATKETPTFEQTNLPNDATLNPKGFVTTDLPEQSSLDYKPVFIQVDNPNKDVEYKASVFIRTNDSINAFAYRSVFVQTDSPDNAVNDYLFVFNQVNQPERHWASTVGGNFLSSLIDYNYYATLVSDGTESSSLVDFSAYLAKVFQENSSLVAEKIALAGVSDGSVNSSTDNYTVIPVNELEQSSSIDEFNLKVIDDDTIKEDEWLPTNTWSDIKGQPYSYLITLAKYPVDKGIYKLFYDKPISYIDVWRFVDYGSEKANLWGNTKTSGTFGIPPYQFVDFITELASKALGWKYKYPVRHQATLMQVGYGYTSAPNVIIDAEKLPPDKKSSIIPIPSFLTWDINSDEVFTSPQIDTRDYDGSIVLRAKAEIREFKEWIEQVGEVFAFIYGVTLMYHFTAPMQFESQSFIGCSSKGLKIIGEMPKIQMP